MMCVCRINNKYYITLHYVPKSNNRLDTMTNAAIWQPVFIVQSKILRLGLTYLVQWSSICEIPTFYVPLCYATNPV